jgi:hypothetical protein
MYFTVEVQGQVLTSSHPVVVLFLAESQGVQGERQGICVSISVHLAFVSLPIQSPGFSAVGNNLVVC